MGFSDNGLENIEQNIEENTEPTIVEIPKDYIPVLLNKTKDGNGLLFFKLQMKLIQIAEITKYKKDADKFYNFNCRGSKYGSCVNTKYAKLIDGNLITNITLLRDDTYEKYNFSCIWIDDYIKLSSLQLFAHESDGLNKIDDDLGDTINFVIKMQLLRDQYCIDNTEHNCIVEKGDNSVEISLTFSTEIKQNPCGGDYIELGLIYKGQIQNMICIL